MQTNQTTYIPSRTMSDKPSRVSIVPPPLPPEKGAFKIEKRDDGVMIATPTKAGKLAPSPSHACEPHAKQWLPLNVMDPEGTSVVSKLSAASDSQRHPSLTTGPVPPRHKITPRFLPFRLQQGLLLLQSQQPRHRLYSHPIKERK